MGIILSFEPLPKTRIISSSEKKIGYFQIDKFTKLLYRTHKIIQAMLYRASQTLLLQTAAREFYQSRSQSEHQEDSSQVLVHGFFQPDFL